MVLHLPLFCVFYDYNFRKGKANKFEFVDGFMKARLGDYIREYSVRNKINEDIPVYSVTNSQGFCKDYFGKEVASKDKSTYKIVPKGCFAYNPSRINVGSVDWQRNEERVIVSPLYNVFSVSSDLDNQYLYYFLKSDIALCLIKNIATGSVRDNLKLSMLYEFPINLPNIERQKEIVSTLDKLQSIITHLRIQLEKLDLLVKARFVEMFGEVATENYKYPTYKLGNVAYVGSSHRVFTSEFVEKGIPFYRGTEIGELASGCKPTEPFYISEEHYNKISSDNTKPQIGDLLMPSICNKGQVWRVDTDEPFYYKDGRVLCISADRDKYNTVFLQFFMREKTIIEYPKLGSGSTFAEFKIFLLKDIDVLTPPIDLQTQFADFVKQVDQSKSILQQELDKTQTLFDSLMQEYFG